MVEKGKHLKKLVCLRVVRHLVSRYGWGSGIVSINKAAPVDCSVFQGGIQQDIACRVDELDNPHESLIIIASLWIGSDDLTLALVDGETQVYSV